MFQGKEYIDANGLNLFDFGTRQYDTYSGRFTSLDGANQFASGYTGMGNLPNMGTDPTGQIFGVDDVIIGGLIIGAITSAVSYTVGIALSQGGFNNWNWGKFVGGVAIGAASGAITAGIGSEFGAFASQGFVGEVGRTFAHGTIGGLSSIAQGGSFGSGFLSAGAGSLVGGATQNWNDGLQMGISALSGGVTSSLSGGDFWRGFAQAGIVAGANHMLHPPKPKPVQKSWYKKNYNKIDATLGVTGGIAEVVGGLAGEGFSGGASTALIIDGYYRIVANGSRLLSYAFGNDELGDNIPSNAGGLVGKFADGMGGTGWNQTGQYQALGGFGNDVGTMVLTGGTGGAIAPFIQRPNIVTLFGGVSGVYSNGTGAYNNAKSIQTAFKK